jgi:UDP-N-acetylglucosamine--N-acetylmuramyl-(pentapeptide) pyrophosphoryl-undecaprenol N-acetylglucosamine transferase
LPYGLFSFRNTYIITCMLCVSFTGGGTGGHIYPGLAVASSLMEKAACRIFWIGLKNGMDRDIVKAAGLPFYGIPAGKFRRNLSLKNISDVFRVGAGFFAARSILAREKPALLFSKGGFVSVPPCAAAASLGITVFTHESDVSPGLATRLNARFAARGGKIITAYPETAEALGEKYRNCTAVLGNPVRSAFRGGNAAHGRAFAGLTGSEKLLLVLGGSQGAKELNDLVKETLPELTRHFTVIHQTGPNNDVAAETDGRYKTFSYIKEEMPDLLAAADLVLGRSGAGTVWECAAAGKPMILVPLSGAGTRGDQVENAVFFEKAGAALVIGPETGNAAKKAVALRTAVTRIAEDAALRETMAASSAALGKQDAASAIADAILAAVKTAPEGGNRGGA